VLKLVGIGVIATVGLQALINMAVVTGLGPTKGIALPLLSSGGTGWILTAACLGLLVNMDRTGHRYGLTTNSPPRPSANTGESPSASASASATPGASATSTETQPLQGGAEGSPVVA
jgi:hypothetical protein